MVVVELSLSSVGSSPQVPREDQKESPIRSSFSDKEGDVAECSPVLRRWKANARERRRVQTMRTAFEGLRRSVPFHQAELHLTRMDLLCRAMEYIRHLERKVYDICDGLGDSFKPPLLKIVRGGKAADAERGAASARVRMSSTSGSEDITETVEIHDVCPIVSWLESPIEELDLPCFAQSCSEIDPHSCQFLHSGECTVGEESKHVTNGSNSDELESLPPAQQDGTSEDSDNGGFAFPVFIRRKQRPKRVAINAQLRLRSKAMQSAFDDLRGLVPVDPDGPHLTKAKVLLRASRYIEHLRSLVEAN